MEDDEERCARERENRTRLRAVLPTEQRGRERENGRWTERELRVLSEQSRISLEKATPTGGSCAFVRLWEGRPPRALALVSRTCGCFTLNGFWVKNRSVSADPQLRAQHHQCPKMCPESLAVILIMLRHKLGPVCFGRS